MKKGNFIVVNYLELMLKRNNAEIKYNMEYVVHGGEIDEETNGQVNVLIKCPYNFNLRINKFLQKRLGIQRKVIDKLLEDKVIDLKENVNIKKYRIRRDLEIVIHYERIKEIMYRRSTGD